MVYEVEDVMVDEEGKVGVLLRNPDTEDGFAVWFDLQEFQQLEQTGTLQDTLKSYISERINLLNKTKTKAVDGATVEQWRAKLKQMKLE